MTLFRTVIGRAIFACPGTSVQRAAQRLLRGPRDVSISLRGKPFGCTTAHKYYWLGESYESDTRRLLESHLGPEAIFYDVGAHFGFWELMLSGRCDRIVAVEPSPSNFARLRKNVAGIANVVPLNVAASDSCGSLAFSEDGSMSRAGYGNVTVRSETLDSMAQRFGFPSLIKIDVEGFAGKVLSGASTVLARKPVIVAEIHNDEEFAAFSNIVTIPGGAYPYRVTLNAY